MLVVDGVLVRDLDQLRLLVDHQHRLGEQGAAATGDRAADTGALLHLLLDGRGVAGAAQRELDG